MQEVFLSVIIPAYNEEQRIKNTLEDLKRYFSVEKYSYEVIVVNDGSTDKTGDIVLNFKNDLNISVIANKKNIGKGHSVKRGMLASSGKFKLFMDADNSVPIKYFNEFFPYLKKGFDVVIASVEIDGAKIEENVAKWRSLLGRLSKIPIRFLALPDISDSQRGFKLFSKKAADEIFKKQTINGFGFDIEILAIAKQSGFKIKELPVIWSNPAGSKVGLKDYFTTFFELLKIKINLILKKYN